MSKKNPSGWQEAKSQATEWRNETLKRFEFSAPKPFFDSCKHNAPRLKRARSELIATIRRRVWQLGGRMVILSNGEVAPDGADRMTLHQLARLSGLTERRTWSVLQGIVADDEAVLNETRDVPTS